MNRATAFVPLFLLSSSALAAPDRTGAPYFFVGDRSGAEALPLESTRHDVSIAGSIARVRVRQTYRNRGSTPIEAVYVFPASTRSAIFGLSMKIGDRTINARIMKRADAARTYDAAKNQGKNATLLEQDRPNMFRMSVANILPGDRIDVDLDYVEDLTREAGEYELVIPTVVGPRFTGESADPPTSAAAPYLTEGTKTSVDGSIAVRIAAGTPLRETHSPSHDVAVRSDSPTSVRLELEHASNKDFILRYRLDGEAPRSGILLFPGAKESFFLATIEPPARVEERAIPRREYVFVVDVSGSMSGFPLDVARSALRTLFKKLRPEDRFNVVQFSGGAMVMAEESLPATSDNLARAEALIANLRGGGGTEVLGALQRTLAMPRADGFATSIVVLTDGYVTVEKEAFKLVRESLGKASLYAMGIGTSVNRELIEVLARAGMAEAFVATSAEEAEAASRKLIRAIESPVLTDVATRFEGFEAYDVEPQSIPDLRAERPVVIFGKYRGKASGRMTLTGASADGPFVSTIDVGQAVPSDDLVALRYLWARHRIRTLGDLEALGEAGTEQSITALGLTYGLMSAYTSFVAVDSQVRNAGGESQTVDQPLALPEGVSNNAIGSAMPMAPAASGASGVGGLGIIGHGAGGGGLGRGYSAGAGVMGRGQAGKSKRELGGASRPASQPRISEGKVGGTVAGSNAVVTGSLSKEVVQRVIRSANAELRRVFDRELQKNPQLSGKIIVSFRIGADGSVSEVKIVSSTLGNAEVEKQLAAVFAKLRFPAPAGGGSVLVSYPVILSPR
ncbi:MAG: TonB family protein [Deltaproteobacteria bacterium]|nr:TonB family protein [Deltaproteobacteria bacterium]